MPTKKLKRWRPFARSKKMRDVREKPKTKRLLKLNKLKLRKRWIWTSLPNMYKGNGIGSKQRVSSSPRREREVKKERRRRSENN